MKKKTGLVLAAVLTAVVAYAALSRSQHVPQKTVSSAQPFSASSVLTEENVSSEPAPAAEIVSQLSSEARVPSSQISEEPPEESSQAETSQPVASSSNPPKESSSDLSVSSQKQGSSSAASSSFTAETVPTDDTPKPTGQPVQTPVTETASPAASSSSSGTVSLPANSSFADEVIRLVNIERAKAGLAALVEDAGLDKTANIKARDMVMNDYFDHISPSGVSPFDLMEANGIQYQYAGENIAMGYPTPASVMEAWMNSEGHRENILNAHYTRIGIGIFQDTNGAYYWVQHFAG